MTWLDILIVYLLVAIVLDHAHLVCPIWLGWSNRGFREHMLRRPEKFILLPALCLFSAVMIGITSNTTHEPAFRGLASVYLWWNAWHFGSQHFGVASLLGWRSGPRWARQAVIIVPTMLLVTIPISFGSVPVLIRGSVALIVIGEVISFAHWTTDVALTSRVMRQWGWAFLLGVLAMGAIGFVWKTVGTDPRLCGPRPACTVVWSIPTLLGLRYGLGFWHFLMSRWVWKLSDPQVRATIGRALFE
jgi:hypothetical protein